MTSINNVIVVGATGNVGSRIVASLVARNFTVSLLTRSTPSAVFPGQVKVIKTDYSPPLVEEAFHGKDAVVCALGYGGLQLQIDLIDIAERVGVKRFVPSEYGGPKGSKDVPEYTQLLQNKLKVVECLQRKAAQNPSFTWSAFTTGTFLDRALTTFPDFGFDVKNQSATIFDSGNERFTAMTIGSIGDPVVNSLLNFDETSNRYICISSLETSQNELLQAFEKRTGKEWTVTRKNTKDVLAEVKVKLATGDFKGAYVGLMIAQMFEDGAGRAAVDGKDNELLNTPQVSVDKVVDLVLNASQ